MEKFTAPNQYTLFFDACIYVLEYLHRHDIDASKVASAFGEVVPLVRADYDAQCFVDSLLQDIKDGKF